MRLRERQSRSLEHEPPMPAHRCAVIALGGPSSRGSDAIGMAERASSGSSRWGIASPGRAQSGFVIATHGSEHPSGVVAISRATSRKPKCA